MIDCVIEAKKPVGGPIFFIANSRDGLVMILFCAWCENRLQKKKDFTDRDKPEEIDSTSSKCIIHFYGRMTSRLEVLSLTISYCVALMYTEMKAAIAYINSLCQSLFF